MLLFTMYIITAWCGIGQAFSGFCGKKRIRGQHRLLRKCQEKRKRISALSVFSLRLRLRWDGASLGLCPPATGRTQPLPKGEARLVRNYR